MLLSDLKIRTKKRGLVTLEPNPVQAKYLDEILPDWREGDLEPRGLREIILKARQFGFSTLIEALLFLDTINNPNTNTVVIAHDAKSTANIFRMVRTFYDNLPEAKKPAARYANKNEFEWTGLGSTFLVGTAGSDGFGRGGTIHNVHASEVSKWRNAEEIVAGLFEAVPVDGNIFVETTANGLGNWYHSEFVSAQQGDSVYTPRFFAWFEHPDYQKPLDGPLDPPASEEQAEKEEALRKAFAVTDEQLAWRRDKIKALREKFPQEYPSTPREAFITSGAKYFDGESLDRIDLSLASVRPVEVDFPTDRLRKNREKIEVFQAPLEGRQYVLAADPSEGLNDDGDHDFCSADVVDCETWEQVAHVHGRWEPHEFGLLLADLGWYYGTALIGVERNNHGHAVLSSLIYTAEYPPMETGSWSGVYYHEEYDEKKRMKARKPGWPTTVKTKFFALDGLATSILDDSLKINAKGTVSELMSFLKLPGGKAGAAEGAHDDQVMSLSIADALVKAKPPQAQQEDAYEAPDESNDYDPMLL